MATFKDKVNRDWRLELTVASAKRVKSDTGIDLLKILDPRAGVIEKLDDPYAIYSVIISILSPQLDARSMTADDLGNELDEETLAAAGAALIDAVLDFFPPGKARPMKLAIGKIQTALRDKQTEAMKVLEKMVEEIDANKLIAGVLSGDSPDNSE